MRTVVQSFSLCISGMSADMEAQTVDGGHAPLPPTLGVYQYEPREDPLIGGVNRKRARVTSWSFDNIA